MEKKQDRHQLVTTFLESLGLDQVRIERLKGSEGGAYRYYAWRSGDKEQKQKKPRFWGTLTLVEDSLS